jgi:uncharacterized phage infection (PIP) family protein YhgE
MPNPLVGLVNLPADAILALRSLPTLLDRLAAIEESTAWLTEVREDLRKVAASTAPLPAVARATDVLPEMNDRMASIDSAMPTLVEVQQHLAKLPETMATLGTGLGQLSALMEQLLGSLERLDRNVTALQESIEPLGRIADRLPGRSKR